MLINSWSPSEVTILSKNAQTDVANDTNITIEIVSVLSGNSETISATLSLTLPSCYNGFVFNADLQKCECYSNDNNDIAQYQEDNAEIKVGYWHGIISQMQITLLNYICPD